MSNSAVKQEKGVPIVIRKFIDFVRPLPTAVLFCAMELLKDRHVETTFFLLGALAIAIAGRRYKDQGSYRELPRPEKREKETDPDVLAINSTFQTYKTAHRTYPSIRTFVKGKPKGAQDYEDSLPVLVFVHGLGGSLAQFEPIIRSLEGSAPCFGIDFPGCGLSRFSPTAWDAYTQEALTELVRVAFLKNFPGGQRRIVVIGHSMGCRIARSLAKNSSTQGFDHQGRVWPKVLGVAAICPDDKVFSLFQGIAAATFLSLPSPVFDIYRAIDRRGGVNSASVTRFAGKSADVRTRELQLRFNEQSQTPVFRRVAWGVVRSSTEDASAWAHLDPAIHLLIVGAKDDPVTPVSTLGRIENAVKASGKPRHIDFKVLQGSHAIPYDTSGSHRIAALIRTFLEEIDEHLSTSWQLQHENSGGKWDVKNLAKWQSIAPVSSAVGKPKPIFRALKTLRGVDDTHNPKTFAEQWEKQIKAVIDISQDEPVYDPSLLGTKAIDYYKFATTSKIPPPDHQVEGFVQLVDEIRSKDTKGWKGSKQEGRDRTIGVHCHYGFNRTGFLICVYLIKRCGYSIEEALEEFKQAKPPGIKHSHFVDELYLRYDSKSSSDELKSDFSMGNKKDHSAQQETKEEWTETRHDFQGNSHEFKSMEVSEQFLEETTEQMTMEESVEEHYFEENSEVQQNQNEKSSESVTMDSSSLFA